MAGKEDYILDHLGKEATPELVHQEYDGKSVGQIVASLDEMFGKDPKNERLARMIYNYCD